MVFTTLRICQSPGHLQQAARTRCFSLVLLFAGSGKEKLSPPMPRRYSMNYGPCGTQSFTATSASMVHKPFNSSRLQRICGVTFPSRFAKPGVALVCRITRRLVLPFCRHVPRRFASPLCSLSDPSAVIVGPDFKPLVPRHDGQDFWGTYPSRRLFRLGLNFYRSTKMGLFGFSAFGSWPAE